jgi:hypothetical protein
LRYRTIEKSSRKLYDTGPAHSVKRTFDCAFWKIVERHCQWLPSLTSLQDLLKPLAGQIANRFKERSLQQIIRTLSEEWARRFSRVSILLRNHEQQRSCD